MPLFNHALKLLLVIVLSVLSCNYDFTIGKWEDGIIPYYLKGEFSGQDIQNIEEAMNNWESVCGVKFQKVTPRSSAYCYSARYPHMYGSHQSEKTTPSAACFSEAACPASALSHTNWAIALVCCMSIRGRTGILYVIINWTNILSGKDYNFEIMNNPLYWNKTSIMITIQ